MKVLLQLILLIKEPFIFNQINRNWEGLSVTEFFKTFDSFAQYRSHHNEGTPPSPHSHSTPKAIEGHTFKITLPYLIFNRENALSTLVPINKRRNKAVNWSSKIQLQYKTYSQSMQNKDRSPQVGQSGLGFVYTMRFLLKMRKRSVILLIFEWSAYPFFCDIQYWFATSQSYCVNRPLGFMHTELLWYRNKNYALWIFLHSI